MIVHERQDKVSKKFKFDMYSGLRRSRSMFIMLSLVHYWNKFWMDIIVQYLHMGKQVQERLSRWKESTTIQLCIGKVLYEDASKKGTIAIHGLEEVTIHNKSEVLNFLKRAQKEDKLLQRC